VLTITSNLKKIIKKMLLTLTFIFYIIAVEMMSSTFFTCLTGTEPLKQPGTSFPGRPPVVVPIPPAKRKVWPSLDGHLSFQVKIVRL
jgi:hypothetical protein